MKNPGFKLLLWLMRRFLKKPEIIGMENVDTGMPAIFISNHASYFGPLILQLYLDVDFVPWVIYEITDPKLCKDYLRIDFVEPVLGLKHPFSNLAAWIISPVCVGLMKHIGAIPVFHDSRRIMETVDRTINELEKGKNILIFPESPGEYLNDPLRRFNTGFVNLARTFYQKHSKLVNFYPVSVNKKRNQITIGNKVPYNPDNLFPLEKKRIINELTEKIMEGLF
ncbi:lysophospholipid acyltransferase family protein [Parasporobacterium paucivorans]|uniref:1-acyl-sn-glycerol-3-phosphate acyltransferase n=1 Tax=Parasporobacterium paucivorans DSM 15970 TaxID=1122934 RepID=A0A1M6L020_9FIRM|nr:lysophospholipid acyltransferase family protein [Parasporobacterium paucivorans]SHJ64466.1 1-acyl-sn-glycerol-3-phosphate acyltransferase [Parasporobacterium paucivorans DSM 15970]